MLEQKQQIEYVIQEAQQTSSKSAKSVRLIAVTKTLTPDQTLQVAEAGLLHLGENRPEGLLSKLSLLPDSTVWHYIGSLQTRKVKEVIDHIDYLHSLDRMSLASEIEKRASRPVKCFIQVNVSGEQSKHGLAPDEVKTFLERIGPLTKIQPIGLMTMAPFEAKEKEIRGYFSSLRELRDSLQHQGFDDIKELSMGMSEDYQIAVEEGATFVRIGTALVGSLRE
ncbi:YggS family pyridoxal phosphate-dependent enzyme [Chryseomicrobium palamuruense]|uniref:Pyridoxal phosphate homeostasis protein n=1 Tax=Chryseomicrobium palamuruense TaxID=682973 RepID=A0ABV8USX3_9BACL